MCKTKCDGPTYETAFGSHKIMFYGFLNLVVFVQPKAHSTDATPPQSDLQVHSTKTLHPIRHFSHQGRKVDFTTVHLSFLPR